MMRTFTFICVFALSGILFSCMGGKEVATVVNMETLLKDTTYQGKRVAVEGYICITGDLETHDNYYGISLHSTLEFDADGEPIYDWKTPSVTIYIPDQRDGSNSFYVPKEFDNKDLEIFTNDKEKLPYNAKIKVSGDVDFNTSPVFRTYKELGYYIVYMNNVRIDKAE